MAKSKLDKIELSISKKSPLMNETSNSFRISKALGGIIIPFFNRWDLTHQRLMELYKYATTVRSLTGGRGTHHDEFSHYEEMPREAEQKVIEESKKAKQAQQAE